MSKAKHFQWIVLTIFLTLCVGVLIYLNSSEGSKPTSEHAEAAAMNSKAKSDGDTSSVSYAPLKATTLNNISATTMILNSNPQVVSARTVSPVSTVGGQAVTYPGSFAKATIVVDGKTYQASPNQIGNFGRILVNPNDKIAVQLNYPEGAKGDPIEIEVEDGGQLAGKVMGAVEKLDESNNIQFNFQTTVQPGIYHVAVRNGASVNVLSFWAGQEPTFRN